MKQECTAERVGYLEQTPNPLPANLWPMLLCWKPSWLHRVQGTAKGISHSPSTWVDRQDVTCDSTRKALHPLHKECLQHPETCRTIVATSKAPVRVVCNQRGRDNKQCTAAPGGGPSSADQASSEPCQSLARTDTHTLAHPNTAETARGFRMQKTHAT